MNGGDLSSGHLQHHRTVASAAVDGLLPVCDSAPECYFFMAGVTGATVYVKRQLSLAVRLRREPAIAAAGRALRVSARTRQAGLRFLRWLHCPFHQ